MLLKLIRFILGKIILTLDMLFPPVPRAKRTAEKQAVIDQETSHLALYQFEACPFCVKVRRHIKRLGLKIKLRDASGDSDARRELEEKGGKVQVPCLRIPEVNGGNDRWMYESSEINQYLSTRFG